MEDQGSKKGIRVKYSSLVVIWLMLLLSQLLFLVLVVAIRPQLFSINSSQPPLGSQPLIVLAFGIAAAAFFTLSFVLRRQHLRRAVVDRDEGCVQTGLVLGCALSEVCSLLGVLLAFVFDYHFFFLWIALGTLGILLHFPRQSALAAARNTDS